MFFIVGLRVVISFKPGCLSWVDDFVDCTIRAEYGM